MSTALVIVSIFLVIAILFIIGGAREFNKLQREYTELAELRADMDADIDMLETTLEIREFVIENQRKKLAKQFIHIVRLRAQLLAEQASAEALWQVHLDLVDSELTLREKYEPAMLPTYAPPTGMLEWNYKRRLRVVE